MKSIIQGTIRSLLCVALLTGAMSQVAAQEFSITRFELAGDKLIVSYNLVDTVKNRNYTVSLYSSKDNFLNPVQKVSGDAGLEIAPGLNKKIVWNAKEELGANFEGKVAVEIRGRLYVPFVKFLGFEDYKVRKRGVPFVITWSGGTRQNVLNFDLYNGDTKVWTQAGIGNTGNYEMTIPKSVKPGSNYRFRISDSKNKDEIVYTDKFIIKRKIPLLVQMIPLVGVAAGAYFLTGDKEKKNGIASPPCPEGGDECNN